ncbi:hypothetical protein KQH49_10620 [Mycetohabitans sp. B5]|uniref:Uncharacterized protein n=1 Tax=Mycetohabitans endofungorum TaxID=417203 RepID=A0A2P5K857_9BURK|nr:MULTISPECIES: hypothetical protein [Mycetohabitans]MCG1055363.1 hypothetical protein [Mycetohabitans sp. B5]PPB82918.1 hypothetical protein B0O95_11295 [Mycetohabitans endofungorum]
MNNGLNSRDTGVEHARTSVAATLRDAAWQGSHARAPQPATVRLTVRASTGELRIIAVWAALGAYASHVTQSRIRCNRKLAIDVLELNFRDIPDAALTDIAAYLSAAPWVRDARVQW